ncbi:hypothetical protein D3C87_1846280 [compost metagenome]
MRALAESHDFAGNLQPENGACAGRRRVVALALQHIGPIDAGGFDAHQNVARFEHRQRPLRQHHIIRIAWGRKIDEGHFDWKGHGFTSRILKRHT